MREISPAPGHRGKGQGHAGTEAVISLGEIAASAEGIIFYLSVIVSVQTETVTDICIWSQETLGCGHEQQRAHPEGGPHPPVPAGLHAV